MKTYTVVELVELEQDNYVNTYGPYTSRTDADMKAIEIFELAESDIGGESCKEELKVWNDQNMISIEIKESDLIIDEQTLGGIAFDAIEIFEEVLEKNDMYIPDEDRTGNEEEACIYGSTYYNIEDNIKEIFN